MNNWQPTAPASAQPTELRLIYRKWEAANALGVSPRTLHDLLKSGKIKSFKVNRAVLIPVAEIKAFIANGIQNAEQD